MIDAQLEKAIKEMNEIRNCPNCGDKRPAWDLNHSSVYKVVIEGSGSFISTLFGVCKKCADRHEYDNTKSKTQTELQVLNL